SVWIAAGKSNSGVLIELSGGLSPLCPTQSQNATEGRPSLREKGWGMKDQGLPRTFILFLVLFLVLLFDPPSPGVEDRGGGPQGSFYPSTRQAIGKHGRFLMINPSDYPSGGVRGPVRKSSR